MVVIGGLYEHYKRKDHRYRVIGVAKMKDTMEDVVVYQAEYSDRQMWVRRVKEFEEEVEADGQRVSRFKRVE